MRFVKEKIPLMRRLRMLRKSVPVFAQVYIPVYSDTTKKWRWERFLIRDRFISFMSELETVIYGYWYRGED